MGRPPRIQFEGAFYHVYHRGNRRERIYWDDADYAKFEEFMIEAMNWSGVLLYDWSLMPNHFHFLLQTPGGNPSGYLKRSEPAISRMTRRRWESGGGLEETSRLSAFLEIPSRKAEVSAGEAAKC